MIWSGQQKIYLRSLPILRIFSCINKAPLGKGRRQHNKEMVNMLRKVVKHKARKKVFGETAANVIAVRNISRSQQERRNTNMKTSGKQTASK